MREEIALPEKSSAIALTLTRLEREEWTADGRSDHRSTRYLTLSGIHPID